MPSGLIHLSNSLTYQPTCLLSSLYKDKRSDKSNLKGGVFFYLQFKSTVIHDKESLLQKHRSDGDIIPTLRKQWGVNTGCLLAFSFVFILGPKLQTFRVGFSSLAKPSCEHLHRKTQLGWWWRLTITVTKDVREMWCSKEKMTGSCPGWS